MLARVLAAVMGAAARRPVVVGAGVLAFALAGAGLALRLEPSAQTSTVVGTSTSGYAATQRLYERFGDDPEVSAHIFTAQALGALEETVTRVIAVIDDLNPEDLDDRRRIQKYDLDGWKALFHVVEHMSYHTGQIVLLSKQLRPSAGIDFYPQHKGE